MKNYVDRFGLRLILAFALMTAVIALPLRAANVDDETKRVRHAAETLTDIMSIPEKGIPEDLMNRARAIAVFPHVTKGAFVIGGRWGKGLVSERQENGKWSPPLFVNIGGGSFGPQIGLESTDLVLVFTNRDGITPLLKGKVELGADAAIAAGPVGRHAAMSTDVLLQSGIFSYSRSKGLFAGLSLQGSAVTIDDSANQAVYGKDFSAKDILENGKVHMNAIVQPFVNALTQYTPAKPIS
jgi:lipid-binding SYLF domain-containing protein